MKEKKEKKLGLGKETIQDLDTILDRDEQKRARGGSKSDHLGTTEVPVFC